MAPTPDLLVRRLSKADDRSKFRCGDPDLDRFFHRYAGQNQFRHHIAICVSLRAGAARAFRVPGRGSRFGHDTLSPLGGSESLGQLLKDAVGQPLGLEACITASRMRRSSKGLSTIFGQFSVSGLR